MLYMPSGHGHGCECHAFGIEAEAGPAEPAEGGIQNCPDHMGAPTPIACWAVAVARPPAEAAGLEATWAAGSGLTWAYAGNPAGGMFAGWSGPPMYPTVTLVTWMS